jgi:small-conductance mechanosensitive channel
MSHLFTDIPQPFRQWLEFATFLVLTLAVTWLIHRILYALVGRVTDHTGAVADTSAVRRTRRSARVVLLLLAAQLTLPMMPTQPAATNVIHRLLSIALIASITWLVIRVVGVVDDVILAHYDVSVRDNLEARRVQTQTRVVSRTVMILIGGIGFATILMTFPPIRQVGASLLASAGIAGLVAGLAARPTISNLIAGLQIALTQPIRLDDVVVIDGEWGRIDEITSTYVVVRIWDQRRLIVPLQKVIDSSFQNWTRSSAEILGTVFVYTDYTVPMDEVRTHLSTIVEGRDEWDGRVCQLVVTDAKEHTLELRALVSAADSGKAWDLRCHVREKLVEYLQLHHPECLPRTRAEIETSGSLSDASRA